MCRVKWERPNYLEDLSILKKYEEFDFDKYLQELDELIPYLQRFFEEINKLYCIDHKLVRKRYYYFTAVENSDYERITLFVLLAQMLSSNLHYECNRRVVLKCAIDIYCNSIGNVQKKKWRLEIRIHNDNITGREALEFFGMSFFHMCERLEGLDCDGFKYEGSEGVREWVLDLLERVKRAMIEDSKRGKDSYIWRVIHECCWPYKLTDVDKDCE